MNAPPRRIVSLVPSTTESVCAFGVGDRLAACTRYCTEPADELRAVPRIGGTKNPDREAIAALSPDLVLGNAEENRPEDLEWFAARVPTLVQTPRTVVEAAAELRALAQRLDVADACAPLLLRVEAQLASAQVAALDRWRPRVYYAIWRKPWMTVGRDTFVHDVLRVVGADNVAADEAARYPEMAPEVAVERGVDLVLLASEPWEFDERQRRELLDAGAFGDAAVLLCDGRDFCWHGARMADGLGRALALLQRSLGDS